MITKTSGQYDKEVIQRLRLENLGPKQFMFPHLISTYDSRIDLVNILTHFIVL